MAEAADTGGAGAAAAVTGAGELAPVDPSVLMEAEATTPADQAGAGAGAGAAGGEGAGAGAAAAAAATTQAQAKEEKEDKQDKTADTVAGGAGADTLAGGAGGEGGEEGAGGAQAAAAAGGGGGEEVLRGELQVAQAQIRELAAKVEAGEGLSRQEQQQQQQAVRKVEAVKKKLSERGADFDPIELAGDVAESVVETDGRVTHLERELQQQRQVTQQLLAREARRQEQERWGSVERDYAGVDVRGVWDKALAEAAQRAGVDLKKVAGTAVGDAVANMANAMFHERAGAAKKGIEAKKASAAAGAATDTTKVVGKAAAPATTTPGGARVTTTPTAPANSGAALDDDAAYEARARSLVAD